MDLKAFRRDVLAKTTELKGTHPSGYVYLTSVDNRERNIAAGTVTEVTLPNAARHLCERSHVISTPEEIESYRLKCEENRAQIIVASRRTTDRELRISTK